MQFASRSSYSRETVPKSYGRNYGTRFRNCFRVFQNPADAFPWNSTTPQEHQPAEPDKTSLCGIMVFFLLNLKKGEGGYLERIGNGGRAGNGNQNATMPQIQQTSGCAARRQTPAPPPAHSRRESLRSPSAPLPPEENRAKSTPTVQGRFWQPVQIF